MSKVMVKGKFETAPANVSNGNDVDLHLSAKGYVIAVNADGSAIGAASSGGTQYTEDTASTGAESLTLSGAVRQDTIGSSTSTDGDYAYLKVNSVGRLYTSSTIDTALPAGTNVIGHVIADTGSTTAVTGNVTVVQGTGTNLHVVVDSAPSTAVTGSVTATQATGTNLHTVVDSGTVSVTGTVTVDSELPAAAALADATANPTVPTVGSVNLVYNGTTWDRQRSVASGNGTSGTGVAAAGMLGFDGSSSNYTRIRTAGSDAQSAGEMLVAVGGTFNGSNVDRARSVINGVNSNGIGVAAAGLMAQFDDTSPNSITENQFGALRMSADRRLYVESNNAFNAISTATTTVVKSGAGFLQRIIVTGGTTGTIVIYDNTTATGTKIADFDTTNTIASYEFNAAFGTGLTIVTGAATKVTAIYR